MKKEPKNESYAIFRAVFADSRCSFFAPKPHGNACYAGSIKVCFLSKTHSHEHPSSIVDHNSLAFGAWSLSAGLTD